MKPVFQEIIDEGKGDCFSAALASLLELPLGAVPKFRRDFGPGMMAEARRWLAEHYGLSLVTIQLKDVNADDFSGEDIRLVGAVCGTPCILSGRSPNIPGAMHAVVGEIDDQGMNFNIAHDPNPSGKGIDGYPVFVSFLVPLAPRKQ